MPPGTAGITLFIVPKLLPDGTLQAASAGYRPVVDPSAVDASRFESMVLPAGHCCPPIRTPGQRY